MILFYIGFMSITADPKSIKALALDLDGTLLAPGSVLSDRTVKTIRACISRGLRIILATGRATKSAEPYRLALGAEGPMIYFNGALLMDMPQGKKLKTALLGNKAVEFCMKLAKETNTYCQAFFLPKENSAAEKNSPLGEFFSTESKNTLITEIDRPEREMYQKHTGILANLVDLNDTLCRSDLEGCAKAMFIAEPEILAVLRPRIEEELRGSAYITQTLRNFLEILDANTSKGRGLSLAIEHLSLKKEEVIAFGDEENDLPMFDAAGFSAAPSNAKETVKARASQVIGSNAEDGIAAFLEEFFGV